jgi:hypothetical protein
MKIILSAFSGKLKSEVMEVPPSCNYEFNLVITPPIKVYGEGVSVAVDEEIKIKKGRFVPTQFFEKEARIYQLDDIS